MARDDHDTDVLHVLGVADDLVGVAESRMGLTPHGSAVLKVSGPGRNLAPAAASFRAMVVDVALSRAPSPRCPPGEARRLGS